MRAAPSVLALAGVLLLSGCTALPALPGLPARSASPTPAEEGPAAPTVTVTVPATPSPVDPVPTDAASPPSEPAPGGNGDVDPAPFTTRDGTLTHLDFDTPDRNLHCGIWDTGDQDSYYGCTVERRTYKEPPNRGCRLSFGKGFVAPFSGRPRVACRGDVLFAGEAQRVPVLQDHTSLSYGAITCFVLGNEVTCGNQQGEGFTLSATAYGLRG